MLNIKNVCQGLLINYDVSLTIRKETTDDLPQDWMSQLFPSGWNGSQHTS